MTHDEFLKHVTEGVTQLGYLVSDMQLATHPEVEPGHFMLSYTVLKGDKGKYVATIVDPTNWDEALIALWMADTDKQLRIAFAR